MLEQAIILLLLVFVGIMILLYKRAWVKLERLKLDLAESQFRKKSLSSKYGKMTEQFLPFLDQYPFDEQNFRFIGSPVDGIQFEKDKVILVEFKSAGSRLTKRQNEIKHVIEKGNVEFREFRIPEAER